jgi:hypothetical protein
LNDILNFLPVSLKVVGTGSTSLERKGDFEGAILICVIYVVVTDSVRCYSGTVVMASGIAASNGTAYNARGAIEYVADKVVPTSKDAASCLLALIATTLVLIPPR